mmetsp:Transcript_45100/g.119090  ORF Transcript_45100/g.119090 Transcript_45100/m.119090 type:complete len:240 (-) Transcript_45100:112-831(-)
MNVRRAHEEDGAAADMDRHHVGDETLGGAAVDVVEVQLRGEVEELDVRHVLPRADRLILRFVLRDAQPKVGQCILLVHLAVVGRIAHLLQQVALDGVRLVAHRLDEQQLARRQLLRDRVAHCLPPADAAVGGVKDGDPRHAVLEPQPIEHLEEDALCELLARAQVGRRKEGCIVERAVRLQLLSPPLADVEYANRIATPSQVSLQLLADEGLAARGKADEGNHNLVGVRRELRADPGAV